MADAATHPRSSDDDRDAPRPVLAPARLAVEVVTDDAALGALRDDWTALLDATPHASGFQSHAWAIACRRDATGPRRRLFTLLVRDGAQVIAIMPAELRRGGVLSFLGDGVSNYLGPLHRAERSDDVAAAVATYLAADRRVAMVDLNGLREGSPFAAAFENAAMPGWGATRRVETARCPYVDLTPGWDAIASRHKSKVRATWARKRRMLERLGRVELTEIEDAAAVRAALPTMFRLYGERWAGRHESGGFAGRHRRFHEVAAPALADAGHLRLSLLTVDGEVVAYSYGVRAAGVTSSYVLAHDNRLHAASPGLLVLVHLLEAACRRGDAVYDFSLGEESYKDAWATGTRRVFRLVRARARSWAALDARARAVGSRAWVAARGVGWLRDLRREGVRAWIPARGRRADTTASAPATWTVYRGTAAPRADTAPVALRRMTYGELSRRLPPVVAAAVIAGGLRGDAALGAWRDDELVGVLSQLDGERASAFRGAGAAGEPVYCDPTAVPGHALDEVVRVLAAAAAAPRFTVASRVPLDDHALERVGSVSVDGAPAAAAGASGG